MQIRSSPIILVLVCLILPFASTQTEACNIYMCTNCNQGECNQCAFGYGLAYQENYCVACPENCSSCPPDASDEGNVCQTCVAGYYLNSEACFPCPAGTYGVGNTYCTTCPFGYTSLQGSTNLNNCTCAPGFYYGATGQCVACDVGTMSSVMGAHGCTKCPVGYTSLLAGSACSFCDGGYYMESGQCTLCPAGTYSDPNASSCTACPSLSVSPPGSATCFGYCPYGLVQDGSKCVYPSQSSSESANIDLSSGSDSFIYSPWFYAMFGLIVLCLLVVLYLFAKVSLNQKQGKMGLEEKLNGTGLDLSIARNEVL